MALPSHLYDVVQQHAAMLEAMGAPKASLAPVTSRLVDALGASPYAGINLAAVATPTEPLIDAITQALPKLHQASAQGR